MGRRLTSPALATLAALALDAAPAAAAHRSDERPTLKLGERRCDLIPVFLASGR